MSPLELWEFLHSHQVRYLAGPWTTRDSETESQVRLDYRGEIVATVEQSAPLEEPWEYEPDDVWDDYRRDLLVWDNYVVVLSLKEEVTVVYAPSLLIALAKADQLLVENGYTLV